MKSIPLTLALALAALAGNGVAARAQTFEHATFDTVLALYGSGDPPMIATNVGAPLPVYEGERSLELVDNSPDGTPQAYVAWVQNMAPGEDVTATIRRYDDTGFHPHCLHQLLHRLRRHQRRQHRLVAVCQHHR